MKISATSLESLFCLKQFRSADIPSGSVSDVEGTVCCGIHAEVDCWTVCRSKVGCSVIVVPVGTKSVLTTLVLSRCPLPCPAGFSVSIVGSG